MGAAARARASAFLTPHRTVPRAVPGGALPVFGTPRTRRARPAAKNVASPWKEPMKKTLACLCLCAAAAAQAHVVLEYQVAPAAANYKATFKVGHGCGNAATRQFIVDIPEAMQGARPMPKAGWRIAIEKAGERVTRVTWSARTADDALPSDQYDEFVLVSRTPAQGGPVYWPVVQVCDGARAEWVQVPAPGQRLSELKSPAAVLEVLPAAGAGPAHAH